MYSKLIVLYYRRFASGNFLANILCHNKNFVPKFVFNQYVSRYDNSVMSLDDGQLYTKQLELLATTIPKSKQQCQSWWKYELGCAASWAKDAEVYHQWSPDTWTSNLNSQPFELMARGRYCFIVAHDIEHYDCINSCLPGAKIIQLVNDEKIIQLGHKLKAPVDIKFQPYPSNPILPNSIKFDIGTLLVRTDFFKAVNQLIDTFDIKDKTFDKSVDQYYNRYVALHS
jgi:hypothetical protein